MYKVISVTDKGYLDINTQDVKLNSKTVKDECGECYTETTITVDDEIQLKTGDLDALGAIMGFDKENPYHLLDVKLFRENKKRPGILVKRDIPNEEALAILITKIIQNLNARYTLYRKKLEEIKAKQQTIYVVSIKRGGNDEFCQYTEEKSVVKLYNNIYKREEFVEASNLSKLVCLPEQLDLFNCDKIYTTNKDRIHEHCFTMAEHWIKNLIGIKESMVTKMKEEQNEN